MEQNLQLQVTLITATYLRIPYPVLLVGLSQDLQHAYTESY